VALLDGNVMPAQFTDDRINRPDVQSLLTKVSARPNASYTAEYPRPSSGTRRGSNPAVSLRTGSAREQTKR
jgi:2-methylcitrate dehydratase PrpD